MMWRNLQARPYVLAMACSKAPARGERSEAGSRIQVIYKFSLVTCFQPVWLWTSTWLSRAPCFRSLRANWRRRRASSSPTASSPSTSSPSSTTSSSGALPSLLSFICLELRKLKTVCHHYFSSFQRQIQIRINVWLWPFFVAKFLGRLRQSIETFCHPVSHKFIFLNSFCS